MTRDSAEKISLGSCYQEFPVFRDIRYSAFQKHLDASQFAFPLKHCDDIPGTFRAEYLACLLFIIGYMMFFDEGQDVTGREACQG